MGIQTGSNDTLTITADTEAYLRINVTSSESIAVGILSDYDKSCSNDNVVIGGKANIIVRGKSERNRAIGIYANSAVSIIENASFTAKVLGYYNSLQMQCGFVLTKPLLINTTGNISLDASYDRTFNWPCAGYGIYSTSTMNLQNVGIMTLKYPTYNGGAAWNTSWTVPEKFAVNEGVVEHIKTMEIRSGNSEVHTLNLESAVNVFGKSTGQYFSGDVIDVFAKPDVSGLTFKAWTSSVGLIENTLAENTTYTMPNSDATVTANYSPFASQPEFTKISTSSGKITFALNEGFNKSGQRLVKDGETAEDIFSSYHEILNIPYEVNAGTENYQVPNGKYKIAVKCANKWYYSDVFTVEYAKQMPEGNSTNKNETTNVNGNSKENNTQQNVEIITENVQNTKTNNAKLPQAGEEFDMFTMWLWVIVIIGAICLMSILLIERKKKFMTKK